MAGLAVPRGNLEMRDGKINKGHSWKPFREDDITFQLITFICDFHLTLNIWICFYNKFLPQRECREACLSVELLFL